jgi:hypothetical protein
MEVFSSYIVKIDFDVDRDLLYVKRLDFKTDDEYRKQIEIVAEMIKKYKPKYIIADNKEFYFPIVPELQNWSVNILTPLVIKEKVRKIVYIESEDYIASLALEQIINDAKKLGFEIYYVSEKEEAYKLIESDD